ncbi:MAG: hypothetical protein AUJ20_02830 [Comamonadaceae bacterium CG1_02_60_18]|nr:MAG: hypothetical protein AUJ20_02830 [Comamonadaceae bacterium CG1_02_60_18]
MKHEYIYDYADIDAYIRQANQLRSQALAQMLANGWAALKRSCQNLASGSARVHAAHNGHRLAA